MLHNLIGLIWFAILYPVGADAAADPLLVVLVLVASRDVALRASSAVSGRYVGCIKHSEKESYVHVGQFAAVGNLPVVELFVETVKSLLRIGI